MIEVALVHVVILSFMIYFGIQYLGVHHNPAVTLSFMCTQKKKPWIGIKFIFAQLVGNIMAGIMILLFSSDE